MKKAVTLIILLALLGCVGCEVPSKDLKVYFYKNGKLEPVKRSIPTIEEPLMVAISELMAGPNDKELSEGYMTEIPKDTRARDVEKEGNVAIIDFNSMLVNYEGKNVQGMLAQIVYTATGISGVKTVIFKLQGEDSFTVGPDGYVVDHPLERGDLRF